MSCSTYMTCVPPTPGGSYTPASLCEVCSCSCATRVSASSFMSSLVPKCRQPVGQALMQAGSSPAPTRSEHSVHLWTFFVVGIELRNIEGAAGDAILAADAVFLLEIDDAVAVLHDGAVGRARAQAAGIGAVHALILAHQPAEVAVVVA